MWKTVKLGDVCDLVGGGTPSKKNDDYYDGDIPWATVRDMSVEELSSTEHKITELGLKNSSSKVIPANNVIIASRVGLGKVCILRQDTAINQDLRGVIPKRENEIDKSFLFYWFKGIASIIIGAGRGATVQGVTLPFLNSLSFPLPPLAEQQRIVAKLDAAFAEIDGAIESAVRKETEVQKLKASLLSSSLSGDAVMWKTVKLGDVCDLSTGGTPSRTKPEYFDNGDVKWLVSGDVNQREIFDCDGRITQEGLKSSNAKYLPLNSVLIALNGQGKTRGTVALLRINATCNQSLVAISPKVGCDIDTKYIFYVLDGMYDKIRKLTGDSGNDRRGLNMPLIRNIPIPLPPLAEQQRIVAKLDAIFSELAVAKEAIKQSKTNYQAMKSAILAQELQSEAA